MIGAVSTRRRTCFACAVMTAAAIAYQGVSAQEASQDQTDLSALVKQQSKTVEDNLKITAAVSASPGGIDESRPDRTIHINTKTLQDEFRGTPPKVFPFILRWLLGHEYWHQVQYREIGPKALFTDDDSARELECEADVMGAYVVASDPAATADQGEVLSYVQEIPGYIDPLGEPGTHPERKQRQLAISFGMLRSLYDRKYAGLLAEGLVRSLDIKLNESLGEWRGRVCKKIVQFRRQYTQSLSLVGSRIQRSDNSPVGYYAMTYKNNSDNTLHVSISLLAGAWFKRNSAAPAYFLPGLAENEDVELAPGAEYPMQGAFPARSPDGQKISLLFKTEDIPVAAEIVPNTFKDPYEIGPMNTVPAEGGEAAFERSVLMFASDARNGFEKFKACEAGDTDLCDSNKAFEGATSTFVAPAPLGGEIRATLYEGNSKDEAVARFNDYASWSKQLWPDKKKINSDDEELPEFTLTLARKLQLKVYVYHRENTSLRRTRPQYSVELNLTKLPF